MRSLKEIIVVVLWSVLALSLMLVPLGITAVSADNFTSVISENLTFIESVNVSSDSVCFNGYYAWSYTTSTTSYFVYNIPSFKYSNDTVIHYSWPSRDSTNSDSLSCEAGEIEIPVSSAREVFYIYGSDYYCCVFDVDYILSLNPPIPCQYSVMSVDTLNLNHSYPVGYALPFDCLFFNSESSGSYLYFSCFNSHRFRNNYQSVEEQASYCWVTYPDNDSSRVLDISVSVAQNNDTGCYTVDLNKSDNTTPYDLHIDYDFIRDNLERTLLASGVSAHNSGIIDSEYNVSSLPADSYKHSYLGQGYSGYYYYNMSVTSNNTTHYLAWGEDKHYNSSLPAVNNTTHPHRYSYRHFYSFSYFNGLSRCH